MKDVRGQLPYRFNMVVDGNDARGIDVGIASKGSDFKGDRRRAQAEDVRTIYRGLRRKHTHVLVAGDLNDHPGGGALDALLRETDLVDAMSLPVGARPHTRIDNGLITSPATSAGLFAPAPVPLIQLPEARGDVRCASAPGVPRDKSASARFGLW